MADAYSGDRIILKDLGFYGYHGLMKEEKALGQRFFIDLECGVDLSAPATTDHFGETVSYAEIYDVVKAAFEDTPHAPDRSRGAEHCRRDLRGLSRG